eukprot:TRINITY_DN15219_c0_g1_i1.p1 TRINITY_DN15219_c0_g1~~TRINITY_DN15219_c0_g1_i1.p1  ORF type:complete len:837 (+),score=87.96 TRINITY_DN15219_c0_g1_i1:42-2552(+)
MLPVHSLGNAVSETPIDRLRSRISPRGSVVARGDASYKESCHIWNGDITKCPDGIVYAGGESDVQNALRWARSEGQSVSLRSGGHSIPGRCIDDKGIVIDTSRMKHISIDPDNRIATAEAGCLLRDLDWETSLHGCAVPAGTVSHTGIAGLTLGGGWGWLSRSHGLTIDSLLSVTGFLADGTKVVASSSQNPDLFWAVRGAGQCFLAVTQFTYRLHPVSSVFQGTASIPLDNPSSVQLLKKALKLSQNCPNELSINSYIANNKAMVSLCCTDPEGCFDIIEEIRLFATDSGGETQNFKEIPYVDMQRGSDTLAPHGKGYYVKSSMVSYTEDVLHLLLKLYQERPDFLHEEGTSQVIGITHLGGEVNNRACDETAWCNRETSHTIEIISSWPVPSPSDQIEQTKNWARSAFSSITSKDPQKAEIYSNFASSDPSDQKVASWGCNAPRLQRLKAKYDPTNVFRGNVSITPDCKAVEGTSVFDEKAKEKGIHENSHSTLAFEGVRKEDIKYLYSEGASGEEVFNEDFEIETIDFKLFMTNKREFSDKLGKAMEDTGFCVLRNCHELTGYTASDYERVDAEIRSLFQSTVSTKQKYAASRPRTASVNQGYFGHKQTSGIHPDLVEGWVFSSPAFDPSVAHNYWPDSEPAEFFKEYVASHLKLVSPLTQAVLTYLGLSSSEVEAWCSERVCPPQHALRLNYYPPVSREDAASGAGRLLGHEDVTLFTILPAPKVEGLQILLKDGSWARVRSPPGSIIINTGDYMQRLTNDRLRSTTHRVATPSDLSQVRTSSPINIYLWEEQIIDPLVPPTGTKTPYPPVKAINFHTSITEKFYGEGYKEP